MVNSNRVIIDLSILSEKTLIGRPTADNTPEIIIPDPRASRKHAAIVKKGKSFYLEKRDGTEVIVNGRAIDSILLLKQGDIIQIFGTEIFLSVKQNRKSTLLIVCVAFLAAIVIILFLKGWPTYIKYSNYPNNQPAAKIVSNEMVAAESVKAVFRTVDFIYKSRRNFPEAFDMSLSHLDGLLSVKGFPDSVYNSIKIKKESIMAERDSLLRDIYSICAILIRIGKQKEAVKVAEEGLRLTNDICNTNRQKLLRIAEYKR